MSGEADESRSLYIVDPDVGVSQSIRAVLVATVVTRMLFPVVMALVTDIELNFTVLALYVLVIALVVLGAYVFLRLSDTQLTRVGPTTTTTNTEEEFVLRQIRKQRGNRSARRLRINSGLAKELWAPAFAVAAASCVSTASPVFATTVESANGVRQDLFEAFSLVVWASGFFFGLVSVGRSRRPICTQPVLVVYSIARALFIPVLCSMNLFGNGLVKSDFIYAMLQFGFGFTDSHLAFGALVMTPSLVADVNVQAGDDLMSLALSFGLAAGALCSYLLARSLSSD